MSLYKHRYPTYLCKATKRDLSAVFELVNAAYKVEIGSTGVAYKNCDKYRLRDQTRKQLDDMLLIRNHRQVCFFFLQKSIVVRPTSRICMSQNKCSSYIGRKVQVCTSKIS